MKKSLITGIIFLCMLTVYGQNIESEKHEVSFYSYPLKPLDKSVKTYSFSFQASDELSKRQSDDIVGKALVLPGYEKTSANGDVQVNLLMGTLKVVDKEIKDNPFTVEKDGKKTVYHKYSYNISYVFPAKLRLISGGQTVAEHELPSHFKETFYPTGEAATTKELSDEYGDGARFENDLLLNQVNARIKEVSALLASNYGKGPMPQTIWLSYIKEKKGEYDDLKNAYGSLKEAFGLTSASEYWLNDAYKGKVNDAVAGWTKALTESSEDKKARIDTKVTAMIYYDLAVASYALDDVDKSEEWLNKITKKASGEIEAAAGLLKDLVKDRRARLGANGLISGQGGSQATSQQEISSPAQPKVVSTAVSQRSYIVTKPGDTLDTKFVIPSVYDLPHGDSVWLQDNIAFMKDGKKVTVVPDDNIHGYFYKGVYRETLTWTKDMNTKPWTFEKHFCKRIVNGAIDVYERYEVKPSFRDPSEMVVVKTLWYRNNKKDPYNVLAAGWLNFNKGVSKLVSDYTALSELVKNGEFKSDQFIKIAEEYNLWAANAKP